MLAIPARTWKRFKSYLTLHNRALKTCFQCRRVYLANKNFFIKSRLIVGYADLMQQGNHSRHVLLWAGRTHIINILHHIVLTTSADLWQWGVHQKRLVREMIVGQDETQPVTYSKSCRSSQIQQNYQTWIGQCLQVIFTLRLIVLHKLSFSF